jgi:hypothetical protein
MSTEALVIALMLEALKQAGAYGQLLSDSRARGTPITNEELDALRANADAIRDASAAERARQLAEGA